MFNITEVYILQSYSGLIYFVIYIYFVLMLFLIYKDKILAQSPTREVWNTRKG